MGHLGDVWVNFFLVSIYPILVKMFFCHATLFVMCTFQASILGPQTNGIPTNQIFKILGPSNLGKLNINGATKKTFL